MGQSIFINFDSETLTSRCRGIDDLRTRKFSPFVAGDSIVFDLFLTGTSGLLNIQDYTTRIGVGNLNARPESGEYLVGGFTLDYNNSAVDLEATIESATGNGCSVIELSPFVFKVSFDAVGAQTIPAIDSSDLSPRSTVDRQTLQAGDATTKEIWLWRLYANPIAFTDVFTNIAGDGVQGTIALSTAGIYDLLGDNASVKTFFEIELTDSVGDIITVMQTSIVLTGEVIGEGFTGYIPSPSMPAEANAFLESFPDPTIVGNLTVEGGVTAPNIPHNTNSVIICNQGDNIQSKYDEAAVLSISNKVTLLLMAGTYGDLAISNTAEGAFGVDVIGVGTVIIGNLSSPSFTNPILSHFKNFLCSSLTLDTSFGLIEDIRVNGAFIVGQNLGTIRKVTCYTFYTFASYGTIDDIRGTQSFTVDIGGNYGTIKNCSSSLFIATGANDNQGIIDNCHSTNTSTTDRSFFGRIGSSNQGTIKNCTAKGGECFGQQTVTGVTENCTSGDRAFAGSASNLDFSSGLGVQGTYKNCVAGNLSFFGYNDTTNGIKTVEATYINCTAGLNSFGFVNTVGAETHFSGKAINCTGETNSFFNSGNGNTKILNGAILENCIGGVNSFAKSPSSDNEGAILRCRTGTFGASAFSVTGTGKVRLCLDGNYNEINLG